MSTADSTPTIPVPWDKLLLWVQQKIAHEMQTGQPVVLTRSQLQAVSQFVSFNDEPDVSDYDYVSLLMQRIQSLRLSNPIFADQEPVSIPIDGHFQPLWQTVCTVERHGSFPRVGYGISVGQQAPFFQSKKNAKQFAAKHALHYLTQPSGAGKTHLDRPSISPLQLPRPQFQPPLKQPMNKLASLSPRTVPAPTPSPSISQTSTSSSRSGSTSIFEQIASLTSRLALDNPTYRIEPDPTGENMFRGQPVFKNALRVPSDLGVVSGIVGQSQAKLKMAESVLAWLQGELQRRQDTFQSLWSAANSPKTDTESPM